MSARVQAVAAAIAVRVAAIAALPTLKQINATFSSAIATANVAYQTAIAGTPTDAVKQAALNTRIQAVATATAVRVAAIEAYQASLKQINATFESAMAAAHAAYKTATESTPTTDTAKQAALSARVQAVAAATAVRVAAIAALPPQPIKPLAPVIAPKPTAPVKP